MNENAKPNSLAEVKDRLVENVKFFGAGLLIVTVLSLVALDPGIGYEVTTSITSSKLVVEGHPCHGYTVTGNLKCSFNTMLYPITCMFGY
ncbi:MAG: hypothetical protein QW840_00600 [Candidatus Bathyarchaeia archaeon]